MERKILKMNVIAIMLIAVIIYFDFNLIINSHKTSLSYGIYLPYMLSILLCSLLLQGEEILTMIRSRRSLRIRWELISLSVLAFLFALIDGWFELLFPQQQYSEMNLGIFHALIPGILVSDLWEIASMFAAGIFLVHAFYLKDHEIGKKERVRWFLWNVFAILFVLAIVYFNIKLKWYFIHAGNPDSSFYILYFVKLFSAFLCALLLMGENIATMICRRKTLIIRWDLIVLGIVSIIIAILKVIMVSFDVIALNTGFLSVLNKIINMSLWNIVYIFAAGMLFVSAFKIKIEKEIQLS